MPLSLHSLPLFPLGTVLFPGGLLPLRIFEVRYLDMIGRCQRANAPFGVVSLTQGHEVRQPGAPAESFAEVGTLARITELSTPQPGLMLLRAEGLHRFRITARSQLKHGLWVADVESIADDLPVPVPPDLQTSAQALSRLLHSLQDKEPQQVPPIATPWHLDDCGWVANRWCELLPVPQPLKQRLMALDNPLLRLELVSDVLAKMGIA